MSDEDDHELSFPRIVMLGVLGGSLSGIGYQVAVVIQQAAFSPMAFLWSLCFMLFEIPAGAIIGTVTGIGGATAYAWARNAHPAARMMALSGGAGLAGGSFVALLWSTLNHTSWPWTIFLGFGLGAAVVLRVLATRRADRLLRRICSSCREEWSGQAD